MALPRSRRAAATHRASWEVRQSPASECGQATTRRRGVHAGVTVRRGYVRVRRVPVGWALHQRHNGARHGAARRPHESPNRRRLLLGLFNVQQLGLTAAGKATWTHTAAGITLTGTSTVSIADWTHLAVVESVSAGTVTARLYVNGTQEATTTYASAGCYTAGEYIVTVGGTTSGTDMWDGSLCNVVAHQKALTAAQVSEIAGGRTGYDADLSVTRFFRIARAAGLSTATTTGAHPSCASSTRRAPQRRMPSRNAPRRRLRRGG